MKKAIEILQEKVTEAAFYLDLDEVNVIVAAMEEYAEQQLKNCNLQNVTTRYFHFDCWKRDGKLKTKRILATCEEHATLLFEKQYPDYAFDTPY